MVQDPARTDPELYRVIFENEQVRVLEYKDKPGDKTNPHRHPNSVMYTLSSFKRKLYVDGQEKEVNKSAGEVSWLPAQEHLGENIGDTETHVIFVELK
jgi:quercetin dioxygenase-like cupin family protein